MKQMVKERIEAQQIQCLLAWEREIWKLGDLAIAGVDEAGRGPLAGPVVAAAVIFKSDIHLTGVNDSKKLSAKQRETLFEQICMHAKGIGIGMCDEKEIDRINILQATYLAMRRAILDVKLPVHRILVDGFEIPDITIPQTAIIKGDQKCFSIAAASIVAKVTRDRMMMEYDRQYPLYGFKNHKGYPTKKHIHAIETFGLCPIHRTTFHIKKKNDYE